MLTAITMQDMAPPLEAVEAGEEVQWIQNYFSKLLVCTRAQEEGNLGGVDADGRRTSGGSDDDEREGGGTGVTAATSKARMWLARYAMRTDDFDTAMRLATELCQDGVEVEEAKALVREVRARHEAMAEVGMTQTIRPNTWELSSP